MRLGRRRADRRRRIRSVRRGSGAAEDGTHRCQPGRSGYYLGRHREKRAAGISITPVEEVYLRQRGAFFTGRHPRPRGRAGMDGDAPPFAGQWCHVAQFYTRRPGLFFVGGIQSWTRAPTAWPPPPLSIMSRKIDARQK